LDIAHHLTHERRSRTAVQRHQDRVELAGEAADYGRYRFRRERAGRGQMRERELTAALIWRSERVRLIVVVPLRFLRYLAVESSHLARCGVATHTTPEPNRTAYFAHGERRNRRMANTETGHGDRSGATLLGLT
jgi:hypothetical protein